MIRMRGSRDHGPVYELLESRTVATASHAGSILAELAHHIPHVAAEHARIESDGLIPLTEIGPGMSYEGQAGGLYGGGSNQPSPSLLDAALASAGGIQPLNGLGKPSAAGRIGVVTIGQSTTDQWFPYFQAMARPLRPRVDFVNAGQNGAVAQSWAAQATPWDAAIQVVGRSGLSRAQVQVLIVDTIRIHSWTDGNLQGQIAAYSNNLNRIVAVAKSHFPDLRLVYIMPFHYAGYASDARAIREPYAYQQEFGIRQAILDQGEGSPVLLWGPYVFADTMNPAFYYDGIHFSPEGRQVMASLTWQFFQTDPAAQGWLWDR
jgi:hypothetical protein